MLNQGDGSKGLHDASFLCKGFGRRLNLIWNSYMRFCLIVRRVLTICISSALLLEQAADAQDAVHKGVSAAPQHLILLQPMRASAQNASVQIAHKEDRLYIHPGESTASLDQQSHCSECLQAHSCRGRPRPRKT